ncbi:MAG: hypothetical protein OEZ06_26755 [Myxococcales bacterium]|nr:hypothetical protein [Myxococcales bacterium]
MDHFCRALRGWLAARIGIDLQTEVECLGALRQAGQIVLEQGHYRARDAPPLVDTRSDAIEAAKLKRWWSAEAARRAAAGAEGHYGYNVFTCARADLPRLVELQRAYYRELRQLVARCHRAEVVVLAGTQMLPMDESVGESPS